MRRVSFILDEGSADVMGDEPVWSRLSVDKPIVETPHGHGAPRFDDKGVQTDKPDAQKEGDWQVVGWITSGGYGHRVGASMAQGYIPAELADTSDDGVFEIEVLGIRRQARLAIEPPFDPSGARMRG